jgi:hypothetical protein
LRSAGDKNCRTQPRRDGVSRAVEVDFQFAFSSPPTPSCKRRREEGIFDLFDEIFD